MAFKLGYLEDFFYLVLVIMAIACFQNIDLYAAPLCQKHISNGWLKDVFINTHNNGSCPMEVHFHHLEKQIHHKYFFIVKSYFLYFHTPLLLSTFTKYEISVL